MLYHVRGTPDKSYKNYELGTLPSLNTIDKVAVAFDGFTAPQEAILEVDVDVVVVTDSVDVVVTDVVVLGTITSI